MLDMIRNVRTKPTVASVGLCPMNSSTQGEVTPRLSIILESSLAEFGHVSQGQRLLVLQTLVHRIALGSCGAAGAAFLLVAPTDTTAWEMTQTEGQS